MMLLISVIINVALTVWILKVMDFSVVSINFWHLLNISQDTQLVCGLHLLGSLYMYIFIDDQSFLDPPLDLIVLS